VASVVIVASAAPLPLALNNVTPPRKEPMSSDKPAIPLVVIITAANTVSLARVAD
jgi:hypothetical protein